MTIVLLGSILKQCGALLHYYSGFHNN